MATTAFFNCDPVDYVNSKFLEFFNDIITDVHDVTPPLSISSTAGVLKVVGKPYCI